jgi:hypothetical protein
LANWSDHVGKNTSGCASEEKKKKRLVRQRLLEWEEVEITLKFPAFVSGRSGLALEGAPVGQSGLQGRGILDMTLKGCC